MRTESDYLLMSQDDIIIKILEFVCKNKNINVISPELVQRDLFPEFTVNDIIDLFNVISHKRISQITVVGGKYKVYLKYRIGLEDYVKNLKRMTKKQKLHRIVEFLSTEYTNEKQSFDSEEIAKAFDPELSIYEINSLCEILIDNNDVANASTGDSYAKDMVEVLVIARTRTAYHTEKYLNEEDELFNIPVHQNISAKNLIYGNVSGTAIQDDHSNKVTKGKGKPKWLKLLYWILGAAAIIIGIIEAIKRIF